MSLDEQNLLLTQTTSILLGTRDFRQLANQSVKLVVKALKKHNLIGAGIFRVHEENKMLYAYAYAVKNQYLVDKLLPNNKFFGLNIPLSANDNLIVRAVAGNQPQYTKRIAEFSHGVLAPEIADKIQKIVGGRLGIALPIQVRTGKAAGAIVLGLNDEKINSQQLLLFETFAKQLGLAFSNVFEFERLMKKYEKSSNKGSLSILEEDIPNIKFTLRLSARQSRNLKQLAQKLGKTQAEAIRNWLDNPKI